MTPSEINRIGSLAIFVFATIEMQAPASAGVLYGVTNTAGSDDLVMIDPVDGTTTVAIADVAFGIDALTYNSSDGMLYAIENAPGDLSAQGPNELLRIDLANGIVHSVLTFNGVTTEFTGLTYDSKRDRLFAHLLNSQISIAIDLSTNTFRSLSNAGRNRIQAVAYDQINDRIYAIEDFSRGGGELLTLKPETGTFLDSIDRTLGVPQMNGLAFDSANHRLFGVDSLNDELYLLDPATGITDLASAKIGAIGASRVRSLAFIPTSTAVVPEPGAFSIAAALTTLGTVVLRSRRKIAIHRCA